MVTNFANEPNSVYLQDSSGLFTDATLAVGVQTASYPYVGWGTQFLDADRDGHPDIVVVNGHVDDYRDKGGEYAMLPQFYHNDGRGRLNVMPGEKIGTFFSNKHLSRAWPSWIGMGMVWLISRFRIYLSRRHWYPIELEM